jgi:cell pole-organizing protein PopZ
MGDAQPDPSMEDILASIKRVIAEDGKAAAASAAPVRGRRLRAAAPVPPPVDDDVLELDEPITEGPTLLSDNAAASTRERLASLSALRQRSETQTADPGALEAVVREMLKPMLKEWLDQRLPEIVEELVTREIARLTGRDI